MKLPRWLMILMLTTSVLVPLAAAGWWWVTWPERTAREYIELLERPGESERIWFGSGREHTLLIDRRVGAPEWDPQRRTLKDVLLGRQLFAGVKCDLVLKVERGMVTENSVIWIEDP